VKTMETEELLDRVFQSSEEAMVAFRDTAKKAGIIGRVNGGIFSILSWELELHQSEHGYAFRRKKGALK
jgi:hypothetical protein